MREFVFAYSKTLLTMQGPRPPSHGPAQRSHRRKGLAAAYALLQLGHGNTGTDAMRSTLPAFDGPREGHRLSGAPDAGESKPTEGPDQLLIPGNSRLGKQTKKDRTTATPDTVHSIKEHKKNS